MTNVLVDTNILLYAIDEDSKYFSDVEKILNDSTINLFTTSKNISEFLSVITRIPKNAFPINEALQIIEEFNSVFTVLYPTEKSNIIFLELLKKYSPIGLKIHDFEIVSIGLENKISQIVTLNKKDFEEIEEISLVEL